MCAAGRGTRLMGLRAVLGWLSGPTSPVRAGPGSGWNGNNNRAPPPAEHPLPQFSTHTTTQHTQNIYLTRPGRGNFNFRAAELHPNSSKPVPRSRIPRRWDFSTDVEQRPESCRYFAVSYVKQRPWEAATESAPCPKPTQPPPCLFYFSHNIN